MKIVPLALRARFNLLFILQQYFPRSRTIAARKDKARRDIAALLDRQGPGKTIEVERVSHLSREDFRRKYLRRDIPVIFDRAAADWPCTKSWSFDSFKRRFGSSTIKIVERQGISDDDFVDETELTEELLFSDFLDAAMAGGRKYMRFSPLLEKFPQLTNDFDQTFLQTMANGNLGISYLLFIGGSHTGTPLHNAMTPFFFVNACGVKRWTIIPNSYLAILNPAAHGLGYNHSGADLTDMNLDEYPGLASIDRMEATVHPGDIMFVPAWAWHSVRNDSPTIGVRCGLLRPSSMLGSSLTLAWIRLFAARNPSIFEVIYKVGFKKYVPEDQWLLNPRIYWRFARRAPAAPRSDDVSARLRA